MDLTDSEFEKLLKETLSSNEEPSEFLKAKLYKRLDEKIRNKKSTKFFDINSFRGLKTAAAAAVVVVTTIGIVTNSDNPVVPVKTPVVQNDEMIMSVIPEENNVIESVKQTKTIYNDIKEEPPENNSSSNDKDSVSQPSEQSVETNVAVVADAGDEGISLSAYDPAEENLGTVGANGRGIDYQHLNDNEESAVEALSFKIETTAKDVTQKGLTLIINHNADEFNSELTTGEEYYLEKFEGEEWMPIKTTADEVFWNMIAHSITNGAEHQINWEHIYGELTDGKYRIVKRFSLTSQENISDEYVSVTEFEING